MQLLSTITGKDIYFSFVIVVAVVAVVFVNILAKVFKLSKQLSRLGIARYKLVELKNPFACAFKEIKFYYQFHMPLILAFTEAIIISQHRQQPHRQSASSISSTTTKNNNTISSFASVK